MNQELQKTLVELQQTLASPTMQKQMAAMRQEIDVMTASVRAQVDEVETKVNSDVTALIHRLAWIAAALMLLASVLVVGVVAFARRRRE